VPEPSNPFLPCGAAHPAIPALHVRALSHNPWLGAALLGLAGLVLLPACERRAETRASGETARAEPPPTGSEQADLAELRAVCEPVAATATSDVKDAHLQRRREVMDRLRAEAGPHLGRLALEAWRAEDPEAPAVLRYALLEVAAFGAPADARPVLEDLVQRYGSADLGTRTEAVRLLAATSPEPALELLEPLLLEERPSATRPDQATLLRGWLTAAGLAGVSNPRVPATVATSLFQPPEARYVAIEALGGMGGPIATAALEEVLVEASSDGLVRRKAAQSLARYLPADELCALLERVAGHESDPYFLDFLGDMIDEHCTD